MRIRHVARLFNSPNRNYNTIFVIHRQFNRFWDDTRRATQQLLQAFYDYWLDLRFLCSLGGLLFVSMFTFPAFGFLLFISALFMTSFCFRTRFSFRFFFPLLHCFARCSQISFMTFFARAVYRQTHKIAASVSRGWLISWSTLLRHPLALISTTSTQQECA